VVYVVVLAKLKPQLMPPLSAADRFVPLPPMTEHIANAVTNTALPGLLRALKGNRNLDVPTGYILRQLGVALLPAAVFLAAVAFSWHVNTAPPDAEARADMARAAATAQADAGGGGLQAPPGSTADGAADAGGLKEPPADSGDLKAPAADGDVKEPPGAGTGVQEPPAASSGVQEPPAAAAAGAAPSAEAASRTPPTTGWWIGTAVGTVALLAFYAILSFQRLEIFKMLLASFFPLLVLILAVLGSIVMGLATPTEAAAVGALGGFLLALAYRQFNLTMLKESVFLTAKTSAMVCWLFVGSAIFSAAFALLGGQELVEKWVLSMNLTKTQFLVLSQVLIFVLGWPLEWTEIIVIFMPIFIPLLDNFGVDPLFFGLLVALNLQTAFLSPPVAMAAFYLKGVSPPHVTLNQIFSGMLPFMGIQILAIVLLYLWPEIGLWLPTVLYK